MTGLSRSVASIDLTTQTHGCLPQLSWAVTQSVEQTQVAQATGAISQEISQVLMTMETRTMPEQETSVMIIIAKCC